MFRVIHRHETLSDASAISNAMAMDAPSTLRRTAKSAASFETSAAQSTRRRNTDAAGEPKGRNKAAINATDINPQHASKGPAHNQGKEIGGGVAASVRTAFMTDAANPGEG